MPWFSGFCPILEKNINRLDISQEVTLYQIKQNKSKKKKRKKSTVVFRKNTEKTTKMAEVMVIVSDFITDNYSVCL